MKRRTGNYRLIPVVTLVVYFGQKPWDGPMGIHEMLAIQKPQLLRFIPDYRINLISPVSMNTEEIGKFKSDFKKLSDEYGIIMSEETERRLNTMCNLSEVVLEQGIEQGIKKGIEKGIEQGEEKMAVLMQSHTE